MTYRELEARLKKDGWEFERQTGSHKVFVHPSKSEVIVLSGHQASEQVRKGMLHKIMKQAGWK